MFSNLIAYPLKVCESNDTWYTYIEFYHSAYVDAPQAISVNTYKRVHVFDNPQSRKPRAVAGQ